MATKQSPKFQTPYDMWEAPGFDNSHEPKVTIESMAEDADINVIMKRFGLTGVMPENPHVPNWGQDYTEAPTDYRTALQRVREAEEAFMLIPADQRAKHDNDPGRWMDWVNNPQNAEEARKLGYVKPLPATIEHPPATGVATPPKEGPKG